MKKRFWWKKDFDEKQFERKMETVVPAGSARAAAAGEEEEEDPMSTNSFQILFKKSSLKATNGQQFPYPALLSTLFSWGEAG